MTTDDRPSRLKRALRLTYAGLWWEVLARVFWPAATWLLLVLAGLSLGVMDAVSVSARPYIMAVAGVGLLATLIHGGMRFRLPKEGAAEARIDASLPGQPLSALCDQPAIGGDGALWQAHRAQMAACAAKASAIFPDAGLSRRDPFGLRLVALTAAVMALLFGSAGQLGQGLAALAPERERQSFDKTVPDGLGWEGWAEPPAYTRKPTIYLNNLPEGAILDLPEGSTISLRLYGENNGVMQNIGTIFPDDAPNAPRFRVERDGTLNIGNHGFRVSVRPDTPPQIVLGPPAGRRADGRLIQPFAASDDFGVTKGQAVITLDMDRIERRHGLVIDPEPREAVQIRIPLRSTRPEVEGQITADLKKHAWANMPVHIRLDAQDGIGQTAQSDMLAMELPGRRFFDPFAAALIELRRDILWNRQNALNSAQLLRAITWQPEGVVDEVMLDDMRAIIVGMEVRELSDAQRDALAEALWRTAVLLEDGGLSDALERMQRAQEKLAQAMRRGASPDEVRNLMDELRRATDDYLERLAEQGEDPAGRFDRSEVQQMDAGQIQQMMDDIQRLMNEGRMAEAQVLLDQFNRMMENMQVRQSEGNGEGQGQGGGSSGRMAETLRDQRDLADRGFRQMQDEWLGLDGQEDSGEGETAGDLADRQSQLRDDLGMQRSFLPERGTSEGNAAGNAMDRAGRAMQEAERALRDGDMAGALDRQAETIEALRDGIRALDWGGRQGDEEQRQAGDNLQDGDRGNLSTDGSPAGLQRETRGLVSPGRDPLGRAMQGMGGGMVTDAPLAEGDDSNSRARDLQDEIRRRLGERDRPQAERDYLDRLIDQF
ncbi:MAG: DUF4175 domain-containing protein [Paracoccus sp. (in: a-proteobacteria)]